jgi:4-amino-4-deoxy-L-arabinose transferase-like glycosyltransferase
VRNFSIFGLLFSLIYVCLAIFLLLGVRLIPFHPDEVSLLYQSRDFEQLFKNPLDLAYQAEREGEKDQTYRALNPPLPKYVLALGRLAAGYGAQYVTIDWDWSLTWDENVEVGALPETSLLNASRLASTIMVLLSLPVIYLCGKRAKNNTAGILAVILLGTNSLVLLHGRRSMAEGTLIFGITLAILGILEADRRPWLTGIGAAIAASAKMSAIVLAPVGLLSVLWITPTFKNPRKKLIQNVLIFLASFLALYFLLNPFLWTNPIKGIQSQWNERTQFTQGMVEEVKARASNQILDTPLKRIASMTNHLFIAGLQFKEAGNYASNTWSAETEYLSYPIHTLFRGAVAGILMITLTVMGVVSLGIEIRKSGIMSQRPMILLFIASMAQILALVWANPLPFQRYFIPIVPFICLWIAYSTAEIVERIKQATSHMN